MAGIDNNTLLYLRGDSFEDLSPNQSEVTNKGVIISDSSLYINGTSNISITNNAIYSNDYTIEFILNVKNIQSKDQPIITLGDNELELRVRNINQGKDIYFYDINNYALRCITNNKATEIDTPIHIALTFKSLKHTLYIEGEKIGSFDYGYKANPSILNIGYNSNITVNNLNDYLISSFRVSNTVIYEEDFTPPTQPYNSITINKTNQTDTNIEFSIEKLGQETINKVEVLVNGVLSETYTDSFDNVNHTIDKSLIGIGNNDITIRVTYDDNYVEEKVLTHTITLDKLPTSSSIRDVMSRRNILNNTVKVQKNILRDIITQKNVEVLDEDNKLSKLIDKVELLGDYYDGKLWLYKNGDECIDTTGGWQETSENTASVGKSFTKNATHMRLWSHNNNALGAGYWLKTINTINTTPYAKLKARLTKTGTGYRNRMYVGGDMGVNYYDYQNQVDGEFIAEIDLANINGEYNICFTHFTASGQNSEILIHEVWLEE